LASVFRVLLVFCHLLVDVPVAARSFFYGTVHGAIVNWCGHKYGYSNYDNADHSKNTVPIDIFLMGELMQNNHHKALTASILPKNVRVRPTYPVILLLDRVRIIKLKK